MRSTSRRSRKIPLALACVTALAACTDGLDRTVAGPDRGALAAKGADVSASAQTRGFRRAVTVDGIRTHQAAFQGIADLNGGNRAASAPGGNTTAQYVRDRLTAAGLDVRSEFFSFLYAADRTPPTLEQTSPSAISYVNGVDFLTMSYSGSGDVTAPVYAVDLLIPSPTANSSTSGCEASDFAGFPAGAIALVQRGLCTFRVKAINAQNAGASAVIVMNEGNPGRTVAINGTLGTPEMDLPVVGTTFALGQQLSNGVLNGSTSTTVRIRTDYLVELRMAENVIAETPGGDPGRTIVVGARLDGDTRGPAINHTSGAAAVLHIAEVFAAQERSPRNRVRFAFFAAGPFGLLGAAHHVANLSAADLENVAAMLGLDAIGSPNFARFVYDGDNSQFPAGPDALAGPPGSGAIESIFAAYFAGEGIDAVPTPLTATWELSPFAGAGIPVGGLFGGTADIKTAAEAALFGGTAGVAYDPCFQLACDTHANVSLTALDQMSDAAAHVILLLAKRNFAAEPLVSP